MEKSRIRDKHPGSATLSIEMGKAVMYRDFVTNPLRCVDGAHHTMTSQHQKPLSQIWSLVHPGSGMEKTDPGWKKTDSGSGRVEKK